MNNNINKLERLYREQRNYLLGPLEQVHIYTTYTGGKKTTVNPFLHEYSCLAPPTMNNNINKLERLYREQINYLTCYVH